MPEPNGKESMDETMRVFGDAEKVVEAMTKAVE